MVVRAIQATFSVAPAENWKGYNMGVYRYFLILGRTPLYKKGLETYKTPVYGPDVFRGITNIINMNDRERERLYQFVGPRTYSLHVR